MKGPVKGVKRSKGTPGRKNSPFFIPNVLLHGQKKILWKPPHRDKFRVTVGRAVLLPQAIVRLRMLVPPPVTSV